MNRYSVPFMRQELANMSLSIDWHMNTCLRVVNTGHVHISKEKYIQVVFTYEIINNKEVINIMSLKMCTFVSKLCTNVLYFVMLYK